MPSIFSKAYDWKRFWCPQDGILDLSDGGYLVDPDADREKIAPSDSIPFEYIEDVPCLCLLGEPGIGKTTWFNLRRNRAAETIRTGECGTLWLELGGYDRVDDLLDAIFQSQEFLNWQNGLHGLQIFLDGLDELHVAVSVAARRLTDQLRKHHPLSRLCIRFLCRTASWPLALEQRLQELWGKESVKVFELAPLRRCDVEEVARSETAAPTSFLKELESRRLVPFAIKPQTLAFLVKLYNDSGKFPDSQVELYERGCRALCQEPNQDHIDSKQSGEIDPAERFAVASRIAALTMFGDRLGVRIGGDLLAEPSEPWLSLDEICVGSEFVCARELHIRENVVRETIERALFSGRQSNLMGWAHQAYAEFLAAYYLWSHKLPLPQVLNLIVHPRSHHGKIKPQLREVAGWVAAMRPEVYDYIIQHDPEVLVDCAAEIRDQSEREKLVAHILLQGEEEKSGSQRFLSGWGYRKLCHAALADQLLPLIKDRAQPPRARIRAIAMAHHCKVTDVLDALVELVLDSSEELSVRDCAVAVIAFSDDTAIKARLKGLALGTVEEDPLDELKGGALTAVWPDHITAHELFEALAVPKMPNLVGQYSALLYSHVMSHLVLDDLPIALAWVNDHYRRNVLPNSFRELSDKIMALAWEHLDSPTVLASYAEAACARLNMKQYESYLDPERAFKIFFSPDGDKRRQVTEAMLPLALESCMDMDLITARLEELLLCKDFFWLIELLKNMKQEDAQRILAKLALRAFNRQDGEQESVLESVARQCQPLRDELERRQKLLEYRLQRRAERERVSGQDSESANKAPDESQGILSNRVVALLDECEAGNYGKFFDIAQLLIRSTTNSVGPDLTACRFWQLAEPEIRSRILTAARHFVLHEDPADYETSDGRTADPGTSFVCYRILRLLLSLDRDLVMGGLLLEWEKWAPTTVSFPAASGDKEFGVQVVLVGLACYSARVKLMDHVIRVIDRENEDLGDAPVVAKLGECANAFVQARLLDKLKDPQLKSKSFERLLQLLLWRLNPGAVHFAESLLQPVSLRKPEFRDKSISAAKVLLGLNGPESWSVVWPAVTRDKDFGRQVIIQAFPLYYSHYEIFAHGLTPNQLADFFVWLHKECPPLESQPADHNLNTRDDTKIEEIKSYILSDLRDRGTPEALDSLSRISSELPSETWIKETLFRAEDRAIGMDREPVLPGHLLAIAKDSRKRVVQSEAQLLDVVQESLKKYQSKLKQVELPSVRDLWDRDPRDEHLFRPVDEKDFSDHVARHLRDDLVDQGVVVNREVEIRRGDITDIHVDAVVKGDGEESKRSITVIIEVKGCWNKKLFTEMKDQLVDRYMKDNRCQHGLYLVGWFHSEKWNSADGRSKRHAKKKRQMTVVKAQDFFDRQAEEISTGATTAMAFVLDASLP